MRKLATLGSPRLIVLQLLMKNELVPGTIELKRRSDTPPLPSVPGVEVLRSTPQLNIFELVQSIQTSEDYELVDAWRNPHQENWKMSFVRFVYCHKDYIDREGLHSDFVANRNKLEDILLVLACDNLWATQGHLNPYFEKDGAPTHQKVLMIGCAGRKPNAEVYRDGRDERNRGVGPKVLLSTIADKLTLQNNDLILESPEPRTVQV